LFINYYKDKIAQPIVLLFLLAIAMPISFAIWTALLNNFVIQISNFSGVEIGWLQTIREIPGFLAVGVLILLIFLREQNLAILSLFALGLATAATGFFPSFSGLLVTTLIGSFGFHYFETVNQSLQLQWIPKEKAPWVIGLLISAGSAASLVAYSIVVFGWERFNFSFSYVYVCAGFTTVLIALICFIFFPKFNSPVKQKGKLKIKRKYLLYYLLQFFAGARRQIFIVFATFMMVEKFGLHVHELTALFLINFCLNIIFAPIMGRVVQIFGERISLCIEYAGLTLVFLAYAGIYYWDWGVQIAIFLFIVDHLFFALSIAMKTYFQKIADPSDIAPQAAVAFTINHIAAVFLPAFLGYLWIIYPSLVFQVASALAVMSFITSIFIPSKPAPGKENIFAGTRA